MNIKIRYTVPENQYDPTSPDVKKIHEIKLSIFPDDQRFKEELVQCLKRFRIPYEEFRGRILLPKNCLIKLDRKEIESIGRNTRSGFFSWFSRLDPVSYSLTELHSLERGVISFEEFGMLWSKYWVDNSERSVARLVNAIVKNGSLPVLVQNCVAQEKEEPISSTSIFGHFASRSPVKSQFTSAARSSSP